MHLIGTTWCTATGRRQYASEDRPDDALDPPGAREKMAEIRPAKPTRSGTSNKPLDRMGEPDMIDRTAGATRVRPHRAVGAVMFGLATSLAIGALVSLPAGAQAPYPQRPVM